MWAWVEFPCGSLKVQKAVHVLYLPDLVFLSIWTIQHELKPGFPVESISLIGGMGSRHWIEFFLATLGQCLFLYCISMRMSSVWICIHCKTPSPLMHMAFTFLYNKYQLLVLWFYYFIFFFNFSHFNWK